MQDFNLAAKLLLIEYRNGFADTKAKDLDHFVTEADKIEEAARTKGKREEAVKPFRDAEARVLRMLEKLSKQFKQRDPLLSAQGNIPVYYWFAHELPQHVGSLRGALVRFSANVKEALKVSKTDPDDADAELLSFYTMGRTTNDKRSLQGRYDILRKRLFRN
ncbi:MAG: hypothetical protein A3H27_18450 [Acidobacteria bacterium RIFCSPLOWO2_02_FULL_59_13]|nr:MAG: hypothetical protein A3H27_18450 [Acidobacteria bacterium RIFCSPLOWO2_02_FULL_59_13]